MKQWLVNVIASFLRKVLTTKGKRIMFIVLAYIAWSKSSDDKQMRNELIEINNKLNIAKDEGALLFVISLRSVLLEMRDFQDIRCSDCSEIRENIVKLMPSWLEYSNKDAIMNEMKFVFKDKYRHDNLSVQ